VLSDSRQITRLREEDLGTPMLSVAPVLETSMPFYLFSPLTSIGLSWHVLISNYSSFGSP